MCASHAGTQRRKKPARKGKAGAGLSRCPLDKQQNEHVFRMMINAWLDPCRPTVARRIEENCVMGQSFPISCNDCVNKVVEAENSNVVIRGIQEARFVVHPQP